MTITDETVITGLWTDIRTSLVGNVYTTNSSTSATTAAAVKATYNDEEDTLPLVVIQPVDDDIDNFKFGSKYGRRDINVVVDCYAKNTLGADQLIQQVSNILLDNTIDGVDLSAVTTNSNYEPINDANKAFAHSVTFTFLRE